MLVGELVRLRAFESTDLERVFTWINDREVTRFLTARYPVSHADEQRWLESGPANSIQGVRLAIETRDGVHIGSIGLHRVNAEDRNAHLGVLIGDKAYWSNGHG
ncbi:MAG: GNAT family N-acetyltransferase, partial [Chloroflexi bacterium]|nr:GNAT family N-acetyltransferase [Chloroflexota bacterium]